MLTDGQCSGESAGDPNRLGPGIRALAYQYNQDDHAWTGTVRLVSGSQLDDAGAVGSNIMFMVWEDDEERCDIRRGDQSVYQYETNVRSGIPTGNQGFQNPSPTWGLFAARLLGQIISGFLPDAQDDFVGLLIKSSEVSESYSDANMSLRGEDGVTHGRAMLLRQ